MTQVSFTQHPTEPMVTQSPESVGMGVGLGGSAGVGVTTCDGLGV